jgi:competence protein ComEA
MISSVKRVYQFISITMLGMSLSLGYAAGNSAANPSPVNINQASAEQLSSLKGIGAKRAAAIVAYRSAHGQFKQLEDLTNVPGISKHLLDKINAQNEHRMALA